MNENGLNYIDLFAGAGGLSEGFIQSGYRPVAHVEMNEHAAKTIETRIAYYYLKDNGKIKNYYDYEKGKITREQLLDKIPKEELKTVINEEMSEATIKGIFNTIDDIKREKEIDKIDVIIGGPPCQAYSLVGRAQSSHMIVPMEDDPRNELYKMYVQFLKKYKPRMFVFENVAGIKTARGGAAFKNLQTYMKRVGYEIDYHELNAQDFGVLQSRKRVIIVGWLKGTGYEYPSFDVIHSKAEVWDLLKDLPPLTPGIEAREHTMNDMRRLKKYVKDNAIRMKSDVLTGHAARPHTAQDIEIYKRTIDMWFENEKHERLKYDDLPEDLKTHKNRTSFVDRFKVVEGDMDHCHTILAHLSKALQEKLGYNTMRISQDEVRRNMLWVKDGIDTKALPLMAELLKYGKVHSELTILEGIMYDEWYSPLFKLANELYESNIYAYYFDIPFEETLRRHSMRNKSQEFGEEAMRGWWREKDFSSVLDEQVITCEMQADDIVERIYQDLLR